MNKHKNTRINERIYQNHNKWFVTVNPRNACKKESANNLWLPFLDQQKSDDVVFAIFYLEIYKLL